MKEFGIKPNVASSLDDLVNEVISASGSFEYADLAFAIQKVLEESVCQIIQYWIGKTGVLQVALTGGVFANVKLNQKISEMEIVNDDFDVEYDPKRQKICNDYLSCKDDESSSWDILVNVAKSFL